MKSIAPLKKTIPSDERLFEISNNLIATDLFLYLRASNVLIISDIHIGYEESLNKSGILIPRNNYDDLILRLEKSMNLLLKTYNQKKFSNIVLNGDLLHEFSKINIKIKNKLRDFVNFLSDYGNILIIEGNHDKTLKFILQDHTIYKSLIFDDILITHGDKISSELNDKKLTEKIKTIIIGHEHPAVSVKSGYRSEKFKCFLRGKFKDKKIIVMPSCNILIEGTDVLLDKLLSPYLKNNSQMPNFEVFIVEDKIYDFGKLKNFEK